MTDLNNYPESEMVYPERWRITGRRKVGIETSFWRHVNRSGSECWEWTGAQDGHGYGSLSVRGGIHVKAHRMSWFIHYGYPPPDDLFVCHKCDNPPCVNPDHLFLGTRSDNMRDAVAKGRLVPVLPRQDGENNNGAKLSREVVREIRLRYANENISQKSLASEYGINQSTVSRVVSGGLWTE